MLRRPVGVFGGQRADHAVADAGAAVIADANANTTRVEIFTAEGSLLPVDRDELDQALLLDRKLLNLFRNQTTIVLQRVIRSDGLARESRLRERVGPVPKGAVLRIRANLARVPVQVAMGNRAVSGALVVSTDVLRILVDQFLVCRDLEPRLETGALSRQLERGVVLGVVVIGHHAHLESA